MLILNSCFVDCDSDADCAEGLVCFIRDGKDDSIPGCQGADIYENADFCVDSKYIQDSATVEPSSAATAPILSASALDSSSPSLSKTIEPSEADSTASPTEEISSVFDMTIEPETMEPSEADITASPTEEISTVFDMTIETSETDSTVAPSEETSTVFDATLEPTYEDSEEASKGDSTEVPSSEISNTTVDSVTTAPAFNTSSDALAQSNATVPSVNATHSTTEPSVPNPSANSTASNSSIFDTLIESAVGDEPGSTLGTSTPTAATSYVQMLGNDGIFEIFPLPECGGDCDKDEVSHSE